MMRIGIDATALPMQLYGAGNYISQLIQALPRVDAANEYVIFAKPIHARLLSSPSVHIISTSLASRFMRIAWEQTALPILARQHRLDLLHSPHYTMPLLHPCKSVVTFHDMTFFLYPELHEWYKRIYFPAIIRASARRADAIIADSESTRQDILRTLKLDASKVFSVPLGVSVDFFHRSPSEVARVREKFRLPNSFILSVGVLEPRKNFPTLVRAFKNLVERELSHSLVIAGKKGWQYEEIFNTVRNLDLQSRVLFLDYVPQNDLPSLYHAADLFVYPSLYEGFGLPVLEAMACGTPVITSNISSMPEITGDAALLVNPRDETELVDAMQRVLTDNALRDKLARNGLERAKQFSWERTARETLAVYEQVAQLR